jgi:hypothetical protein
MFSHYAEADTHHADMSLSVHERIDDLHRRAEGLAPAVAESAADSGCTDTRPSGPRQVRAWDMIAEALGWNGISDRPDMLALAARYEADGVRYRVGSAPWRDYTIPVLVTDRGVFNYGLWVTDPADVPAVRDAELAIAEAEHHLAAMTEADNAGTGYSDADTLDDTAELQREHDAMGPRHAEWCAGPGTHRNTYTTCAVCADPAHKPGTFARTYQGHDYSLTQRPGQMTAEQCDSETASRACVLDAGHNGNHADGPATWPQDEPRCATCGRRDHAEGTWQGHAYAHVSEAQVSEAAQREARITTVGGHTGTLTGYRSLQGDPYVRFDSNGSEYAVRRDAIHMIHPPAPQMYASKVNSPAELVARFGDVAVHWANGVAWLQGRAAREDATANQARHGWATYLEMARIREITRDSDGTSRAYAALWEARGW